MSSSEPVVCLVTLILMIFFGKKPNESHVHYIANNIGRLTPNASGVSYITKCVEKVIEYSKSKLNNEITLESEMKHITERVVFYNTQEGYNHMITNPSAFNEIADLVNRSFLVIKHLPFNSQESAAFRCVQFKLNRIHSQVQTAPCSGYSFRKEPVVIHLFGEPGIGKTFLVNIIGVDCLKTLFKLDDISDEEYLEKMKEYQKYIYYRPVGMKYHTNYNVNFSRIYVCDDANQIDPKSIPDSLTFPQELIHQKNNSDYLLNVAEIESKKLAKFKSEVIIATDNFQAPDLSSLSSSDAYWRRIDIQCKVTVKTEYAKQVGTLSFIDKSKINPNKIDTSAYNFYLNQSGQLSSEPLNYDQFIKLVRSQIVKIHHEFILNSDKFAQYATIDIDSQGKLKLDKSVLYGDEVDIDLTSTKKIESEKQRENIKILPKKNKSRLHAKFNNNDEPCSSQTTQYFDQHATEFSAQSDSLIINEMENQLIEKSSSLWIKIKEWKWFSWFYVKLNFILFWSSLKKRFQSKSEEKKSTDRVKAFICVGSFLLISSGLYLLYRSAKGSKGWFNRKRVERAAKLKSKIKSKSSDSESESGKSNYEVINTKYNDGEAKGKQAIRPRPTKPVKRSPMFQSVVHCDVKSERIDAYDFVSRPGNELASHHAYVILKLMLSNTYFIYFWTFDKNNIAVKWRALRGFFVKGSLFITNRHFVCDLNKFDIQNGFFSLVGLYRSFLKVPAAALNYNILIHEGETESSYDVVCIDFGRKVTDHVDVTSKMLGHNNQFIREVDCEDLKGQDICIMTLQHGVAYRGPVIKLESDDKVKWYSEIQFTRITDILSDALVSMNGSDHYYTNQTMEYKCHSVEGYCGSVVVGNTANYGGKIMGIHMAGYCHMDVAHAQILTKELIDALTDFTSTNHCLFQDEKHPLQSNIDNKFNVVASIPHVLRSPNKTKIRKSVLHNKIFETTKAPAILGKGPSGQYVINKALRKHLNPQISLNHNQESLVSSLLKSQFQPGRKIQEFDVSVAIAGIPGSQYTRPINRRSSAGYPFNVSTRGQGKQEFLGCDETYIVDHPFVLQRVQAYVDRAKKCERPDCVYVTTSKDELRTFEKILLEKTRSFAAAPLDFVIVFRQKYLDIFSWLMESKIENSSLVGINPYSTEWDYLARRLSRIANPKSLQFIAGDHSNFDGRLNYDILWLIFQFLEDCYHRDDDPVAKALWLDITDSRQAIGNAVILLTRGQPSGNPGTALINTLYNASLTYMCLYEILEEIGTVESFSIQENLQTNYYAAFYGDDNILAVSRKFSEIMHPSKIQEKMLEYGHVYTTDAKDDSAFEYRTMFDISILKRKFVYDSSLMSWFAPIEIPSILEPLNWDKIDNSMEGDKIKQMILNVRIAIRELSMHSEEVFNEWKTRIIRACTDMFIKLPAECHYSQTMLRKILKRGDDQYSVITDDALDDETKLVLSYSTGATSVTKERKIWHTSTLGVELDQKINVGKHIYACTLDPVGSPSKLRVHKNHGEFYPVLQMDQRISSTQEEISNNDAGVLADVSQEQTGGSQIVSFTGADSPIIDSIPGHTPLPGEVLNVLQEDRDHSIKDILCREYAFESFVIPVGGTEGEILKTWNPLEIFLSQRNVYDKLKGFYAMRTDFIIRLETTVQPFVSGGIMLSYFPDIDPLAITNRSLARLQLSQTPNVQSSMPASNTMQIRCPWVSPFLARDLYNEIGNSGRIVFSRLTPSAIGTVNVTAYISADPETLKLEYPTINSLPEPPALRVARTRADIEYLTSKGYKVILPQNQVKLESKQQSKGIISGLLDSGSKVATVFSGLPVIGSAASTLAPILNLGSSIAGAFGFSKTISDKPIRAIRWKPADSALTSEGSLPTHEFTINRGCAVSSDDNPFGSNIDEMSIDAIMRAPNLYNSFQITTSQLPGTVLFAASCNLAKYQPSLGDIIFPTHQMWISQMFQNYLANFLFDFNFYGTHFHRCKLRFIYAPGDNGTYGIGQVMPFDARNLATSHVHEFNGDITTYQMKIEPASVTNMKFIPSAAKAGQSSKANFDANRLEQSTSYGFIYVVVEVPLEATGIASPIVYTTVSFSATDVKLSNPQPKPMMLPINQMESTLSPSDSSHSRSDRIEGKFGGGTGNSKSANMDKSVEVCMGDKAMHLRNILNAYTVFESATMTANTFLFINPTRFGFDIGSVGLTSRDFIDCVAVGYAFWKGSMNIRLTTSTGAQGRVLEASISNWFNQVAPTAISSNARLNVLPRSNLYLTGTRAIPLFGQECCYEFNIPYYQCFHMSRIAVPGSEDSFKPNIYKSGNIPVFLNVIFEGTPNVKSYRSVGDDFRFGFLTALPRFSFAISPLV